MHVGIDIRAAKWYRGTGIGTYTHELIKGLNAIDTNNNYTLFTSDKNLDIHFNPNFIMDGIKDNDSLNFWDNVKTPTTLNNKFFNIYHVPQNGVGLPKESHIPLVITLHDTIPLHLPETVGERYLDIFNKEMKSIVDRCAGIITVSNFSKEDISRDFNFPKEKIYVTYLASEKIYKPIDKNICRCLLKKYYSLTDNYILYVGGFSPRKNISGLIECFSTINHKLPKDMKVVIAGTKGLSYPIYKSLAEDLNIADKIIFPGFIPMEHMPYLYNGASLLVYPSFYEGFGLPPIEAMACGTPVIASNATSIPEILEDSAILFSPHDLISLGENILQCILDKNLRQSLIKKGFKKANSLSWNKTATETLKAYEKIINQSYK